MVPSIQHIMLFGSFRGLLKKFKIWEHFLNDISEHPKVFSNSYSCWHFSPHQVRTLQICLHWLKSAKKTHLFRLIHETHCSNEILYYLFQCWALKINYRALRPLFSSWKQRFFQFQNIPTMQEMTDQDITFKGDMPAFAYLD